MTEETEAQRALRGTNSSAGKLAIRFLRYTVSVTDIRAVV